MKELRSIFETETDGNKLYSSFAALEANGVLAIGLYFEWIIAVDKEKWGGASYLDWQITD